MIDSMTVLCVKNACLAATIHDIGNLRSIFTDCIVTKDYLIDLTTFRRSDEKLEFCNPHMEAKGSIFVYIDLYIGHVGSFRLTSFAHTSSQDIFSGKLCANNLVFPS